MPTESGAVSANPCRAYSRRPGGSASRVTHAPARRVPADALEQLVQDGVAEASALVLGQDGHVDDVEVPAAVADDPAHADDGARLVVHDVARRPAATDSADGLVLGDGERPALWRRFR